MCENMNLHNKEMFLVHQITIRIISELLKDHVTLKINYFLKCSVFLIK